jgi:dynein heavy chain 1
MAMTQADRLLIGQVMLYSQGFRTAEDLSNKVGLLFQLCEAQLSSRSHYDFGLRALKSVLRSAGNLKRSFIANTKQRAIEQEQKSKEDAEKFESKSDESDQPKAKQLTPAEEEQDLLIKSICATISPKLVSADLSLFATLVRAVFPGAELHTANVAPLRAAIAKLCAMPEHSLEEGSQWVDKIMQLNEIASIHHGVIMVGPASTGQQQDMCTV